LANLFDQLFGEITMIGMENEINNNNNCSIE
jgi:hypothetical protein